MSITDILALPVRSLADMTPTQIFTIKASLLASVQHQKDVLADEKCLELREYHRQHISKMEKALQTVNHHHYARAGQL